MNKELLQDREWLLEQTKSLSPNKIAKLLGVSNPTIRYWMKKHDIPSLSITDGMLLQSAELSSRSKAYYADPEHRKQASKKLKIVQSTRKKELSESAKKNWVLNREAILIGMATANTPEKRLKISESQKKTWTDERRIAQSIIAKQLWSRPEYIIKRQISLSKITSSDEFKEKALKNTKLFWSSEQYRKKQATAKLSQPKTSILESIVISILRDNFNIEAKQIALGPWTFDVAFEHGKRKILIECQGDYWHSRPERIVRDKQKATYCERHLKDYELHYIYEYEFFGINSIVDKLSTLINQQPKQEIFEFDHLDIRLTELPVALEFFGKYHYLSKGRSCLRIGTFLGNILIACASFSPITRKQSADRLLLQPNEILELDRFCIHPSYHKKNFASWFLSRTIEFIPNNIQYLLSFADTGKHAGTIYKSANWLYDGATKPGYWYLDTTGHRYHKKTIWDQAKRLRLSEIDYTKNAGLIKITGKPLSRFTYKLDRKNN